MEIRNKRLMLRDDDNDGIPEVLEKYYTVVDKVNNIAADKKDNILIFDMSKTLAEVWDEQF